MVELLEQLVEEVRATNTRISEMDGRLTNELRGVNARLDNLVDTSGAKYRELEQRVSRIEAQLAGRA
jgi:flagellar capping protein FliD